MQHMDKLPEEVILNLNTKSQGTQKTTPNSKLPIRSPASFSNSPLIRKVTHNSQKGREWNILLLKAIIIGS